MSDQDFRQLFDEFLAKLNQHRLPNDQRHIILRVVGKRLGAVLAAAPSASLDEESMQQKIDQLYETRPDQSAAKYNAGDMQAENVEPYQASFDGSVTVEKFTSDVVGDSGIKGLSKLELAIADKLHQHGDLRDAFVAFDQIGDGTLTPIELQAAVNSLGIFLYDEEVEALVQKYDVGQDGCLDYDEFVKAISRIDFSRLAAHNYDDALVGRPAPLPPTLFDLKPSEEMKLHSYVEEIRSKIASHWRSSRRAFLACIDSHTTRLYVNKFAHALRKVGLKIDTKDLKKLMRPYMDESKDKTYLTSHEFERFVMGSPTKTKTSVAEKPPPLVTPDCSVSDAIRIVLDVLEVNEQSTRETLQRYDLNRDGKVSPMEFRFSLLAMGYNVDLRVCMALVKWFDKDGDGYLDYEELLAMAHTRNKKMGQSRGAARPPVEQNTAGGRAFEATPLRSYEAVPVQPSPVSSGQTQSAPVGFTAGPSPVRSPPVQGGGGTVQSTPPTSALLRQISDSVYGSSYGAANLYKKMRQFGEIGVNADDLAYGFRRVGLKLKLPEAQGLVDHFDEDKDGKLSMGEFLHMLSEAENANGATARV
eukprot:gb/GECG01002123.1/.p1 GENE.gb/GECG01002123.1/~~gb/GECG01002123.1/.p1  ORF type:complete len:587 (+),score=85.79 gb/GECG01002123.1/:1-1761(+)